MKHKLFVACLLVSVALSSAIMFNLVSCNLGDDGGNPGQPQNGTKISITYNSNFGDNQTRTEYVFTSVAYSLAGEIFSRPGYTFAGWSEDRFADASSDSVIAGNSIGKYNSSVILYAVWIENSYKINYLSNGRQVLPSVNVDYDSELTLPVLDGDSSYIFGGWYSTDPNGDFKPESALGKVAYRLSSGGSVTLYARWIERSKSAKITYISENGSSEPDKWEYDQQYVQKQERFMLNPVPFRFENHIFNGWSSGTAHYDDKTVGTFNEDVTLKADWLKREYTVKFVTGSNDTPDDIVVAFDDPLLLADNLSKDGFRFAGWYASPDFKAETEIKNGATDITDEDSITLYAKWVQDELPCTVRFESNYNGEYYVQNVESGVECVLLANKFKRPGYEFVAWARSPESAADSENLIFDRSEMFIERDMTLYAVWREKEYAVFFNTNGGQSLDPVVVKYNQDFTMPVPVCEGRVFAGWYLDPSLDETGSPLSGVVRNLTVKSRIDVYAKWVDSAWTVYFNPNFTEADGSCPETASLVISSGSGFTVNNSGLFSRYGYSFAGWSENKNDSTGAGTVHREGYWVPVSADNSVFYAIWKANEYTVIFETDSPVSLGSVKAAYGMSFDLPVPEKSGNVFEAWYTTPDFEPETRLDNPVSNLIGEGTITLYARWVQQPKTVTYHLNYPGSDQTVSRKVEYDVSQSLLTEGLERKGYVFAGWSTNPNAVTGASRIYDINEKVAFTKDTDLYAVWIPVSYSIEFNANADNVQGQMPALRNIKYDETVELPVNLFTRKDFVFMGWATEPNGEVVFDVDDNMTVLNLSDRNKDVVVLYAVWELYGATSISAGTLDAGRKTVVYGNTPDLSGLRMTIHYNDGNSTTVNYNNEFSCSFREKDAGTDRVLVIRCGNLTAEIGGFTIVQREVELKWSDTELTYNGMKQTPSLTLGNLVPGDTCKAVISGGETNAADTDYVAVAESLTNANYRLPADCSVKFRISKADITFTDPSAKTGLVYNTSAQVLINGGEIAIGTFVYSFDENGTFSADVNTIKKTNAGTYKVYWKINGLNSVNYNQYSGSFSVSIAKADAKVETEPLAKTGLVYNGNNQVLFSGGKSSVGTLVYSFDRNGTYTSDVNTMVKKNAGTYTIYRKIDKLDSNNYNDSTAEFEAVIKQKTVGIQWGSVVSFEYNGSEQYPSYTITGLVGSDICTATITGKGSAVGNYELVLTGLSNGNYVLPSENIKKTYSITSVNVSVVPPSAKQKLVYNGNEQKLIIAGSTVVGTMKYSFTENGTYTTDVDSLKKTNAGTYKVYWKVEDIPSSGYKIKDATSGSIEVTIDKAANNNKITELSTTQTKISKPYCAITGFKAGVSYDFSRDGKNWKKMTEDDFDDMGHMYHGKYYFRYSGNENTYPGPSTAVSVNAVLVGGLFTVNKNGSKVRFTSGNVKVSHTETKISQNPHLYYYTFMIRPDKGQLDYVGNSLGNITVKDGALPYRDYYLDLFAYPVDENNGIIKSYHESGRLWATLWDYYIGVSSYGIEYEIKSSWFFDYGRIFNASVNVSKYRTLNADEWNYILNSRKVNGGTGFNHSYQVAEVGDLTCLILFPDNFSSSECKSMVISDDDEMAPVYSKAQVEELESYGCVILPAAGVRKKNKVDEVTDIGMYMTSSVYSSTQSLCLYFNAIIEPEVYVTSLPSNYGSSVRLVYNVN